MATSISIFLEDPIANSDNCSNFYDWFCKDSVLEKRMLRMIPKIKFLVKEKIINPETTSIMFKNNCPCNGSLYDDMRFCDLENNYLGGICPTTGHKAENLTSIWYCIADVNSNFNMEEFSDWSTFKKLVKSDADFKTHLQSVFYIK